MNLEIVIRILIGLWTQIVLNICSSRKYFCLYEACDGSTFRMANNTMNKVVGMGTIHFHMADGKMVTLARARRVPGLRKKSDFLENVSFKWL